MNPMKGVIATLLSFILALSVRAQNDPEFPKGWVLYLEAQQGMSTDFHATADTYVGGLGLSPAITLIPQHLRLGTTADLLYTNKKILAVFGPRVAWKLKTFNLNPLGSIMNLHLRLEQLWGTEKQSVFGGGPVVEAGQLFTLSLTAHRDYRLNYWWFRTGLGFNLLYQKRKSPTGTDPLQ
jgi:hypothetical protein